MGATAIEDKLQDGVPECIAKISKANIKIWVLTGDKLETAINIGYSCQLLTNDMEVFTIEAKNEQDLIRQITEKRRIVDEALARARAINGYVDETANNNNGGFGSLGKWAASWRKQGTGGSGKDGTASTNHFANLAANTSDKASPSHLPIIPEAVVTDFALVITGQSLVFALNGNCEKQFLELGCLCKAVICCRVTPGQKKAVVDLVKTHKKAITLAIGDGANDVSMIKCIYIFFILV